MNRMWQLRGSGGRGSPEPVMAIGGGRNIVELIRIKSDGLARPSSAVLCFWVCYQLWQSQHTQANQIQLGPFSSTVAKTSGRSIEFDDRPFLLKENASYFQRNRALNFWSSFLYFHPHGNREHTDRSCLQLCH